MKLRPPMPSQLCWEGIQLRKATGGCSPYKALPLLQFSCIMFTWAKFKGRERESLGMRLNCLWSSPTNYYCASNPFPMLVHTCRVISSLTALCCNVCVLHVWRGVGVWVYVCEYPRSNCCSITLTSLAHQTFQFFFSPQTDTKQSNSYIITGSNNNN